MPFGNKFSLQRNIKLMGLKKFTEKKKSKFLLVLLLQNLTEHYYKRYDVNSSVKGWKVVYWNILPLINKKLNKIYLKKGYRLKNQKNYIKIDSLSTLIKEYKKIPKLFFYFNWTRGVSFTMSTIDRFLKISGGIKLFWDSGKSCEHHNKPIRVFKDLIKSHKIYLFIKFLIFIVQNIKKIILINFLEAKPKFYFVGNFKTFLEFKKNFKEKNIFKINSYDFTTFKKLKDKKLPKRKNIVFIDQDMGNAFDYKLVHYNYNKMSKEGYWKNMDNLFNIIIKRYPNDKFVIAAHHRRNKYDLPIRKKFIFDKTYELIRGAKLVLCHNSTAHILAVLFRRPIIFVNMDSFKLISYEIVEETESLAKALGSKHINIDEGFFSNKKKILNIKLQKINKKKYNKFENNFISFPTQRPKDYLWKTILKHLDNYKYN